MHGRSFANIPIIKNMWNLIDEFNISLKIIHDLFEGIKSDISEKVKLNSKKELIIYSYRVAGTVGLMMAKILKVSKKSSLKSAIDLGIAMQLTNISRDVIEDLRINRSYINENFEEIKSTLMLAEKFYENSFQSIKEIPISFRFSILVARQSVGRYWLVGSQLNVFKSKCECIAFDFALRYSLLSQTD